MFKLICEHPTPVFCVPLTLLSHVQNSLISPSEGEYEHLQKWLAAKLEGGGGEAMLDVGIGAGQWAPHTLFLNS